MMPNAINVFHVEYYKMRPDSYDINEDIKGYIAFTIPGMYVGVGETHEEAVHTAKLRYRTARKKFKDNNVSWEEWVDKRGQKIHKLFSKKGINSQSVWEEEDLLI